MSTAKGLGTFSPEGDHTLTRTSPLAELAPDAPIVITRAMLTAALRTQYSERINRAREIGEASASTARFMLKQVDNHATRDADQLLKHLHTVAQQVAAAQGGTA